MLHEMHPGRQRRYALVGVPILLAFVLALTISCASSSSDTGSSEESAPPAEEGLAAWGEDFYAGPSSLEERIAGADVIATVRLRSVSSGAALQDIGNDGTLEYVGALEHRFEALDYLKGSGGSELVIMVYGLTGHETEESAAEDGDALLAGRDARWDGREAIVFLFDDPRLNDRYLLGTVDARDPVGAAEDHYTIASRHSKRWLPAASTGGATGISRAAATPVDEAQTFLLDMPADTDVLRASGQAGTPTITLAQMKAKIAELEREAAAGGGSKVYRECLYEKYKWEREVRYRKEQLGGVYYYERHDHTIGSGLLAGARVYAGLYDGHLAETPPTNPGEFRLVGRDAEWFSVNWPGRVTSVRPLPEGEYKFYYSYRPQRYIICDAHPEEELKRDEVFVTVTAPAGTVHEAFFDPAAIGTAVGADAANGVVEPAGFTVGGTATTISSLKWESGTATMELSPAASLSGYDMDVIELDGSVSLTLSVADATSNTGGTLTWAVANQPWHADDQLMLRLRTA